MVLVGLSVTSRFVTKGLNTSSSQYFNEHDREEEEEVSIQSKRIVPEL